MRRRRDAGYRRDVVKSYQEVAASFDAALVARDFTSARRMLTADLRTELDACGLEERLTRMYRGYSDSQPFSQ